MSTSKDDPIASDPLSLPQVVARARDSLALFTDMPIDQIVSCAQADAGWRVDIDIVESAARLGDNDLLVTYSLSLSTSGDVQSIERLRRYTREDLAAARA